MFTKPTDEDYELYLKIVKEVFKKYESLLPQTKKIMVLYPKTPKEEAEIIINLAKNEGIEVLSFSSFTLNSKYKDVQLSIPYDGHLTPEFNNFFSELVAKELKKYAE